MDTRTSSKTSVVIVTIAAVLTALWLPTALAAPPPGTLATYPLPTSGSGPFGIAAGPDGNVWFTEDLGNKIGRITPAGSITEYSVPTTGSRPSGIAAGPDGNLWFTEGKGNKIGRITPAGSITEYLVPTTGSWPSGIAAGPDGNLWFTEDLGNKIGRITPAGSHHRIPPSHRRASLRHRSRPGRQPLVHRVLGEQDRADHPGRRHHRIPSPHTGK